MANATFKDMAVLATDPTFLSRVQSAMLTYCGVVASEGWTVAFHRERQTFGAAVVNSPSVYAPLFCNIVASNLICANEATVNGTVALTSGNVATQAALVLDTDISNAIASQFNSFFRTPSN